MLKPKLSMLAKAPQAELDHPSASNSSRHAVDTLLRAHGFTIHSRPAVGESYWLRQGKRWSYSSAIACLPTKELADAEYADELYRSGMD